MAHMSGSGYVCGGDASILCLSSLSAQVNKIVLCYSAVAFSFVALVREDVVWWRPRWLSTTHHHYQTMRSDRAWGALQARRT
mmetsp:Transcript_50399/g.163095  ORF Transcript_50399/g.163095 Transcript_50399/m.163095 type:complete len:82 (-) Transcript_50399:12-257(-)